jgi:hypothetical protein
MKTDNVIAKLTPDQALLIVKRLTLLGGKIREVVVAEAMSVLNEVTVAGTAEEVFAALDFLDVEDCWARSGRSRDGYTSPDEAAALMVDEELQPFVDQVERYHDLGMLEQEVAQCKGVILGLYRYERESKSEFRAWCEDIPGECAGALLADWRKRNRAGIAEMHAFIREHCPKWAEWLARDDRRA